MAKTEISQRSTHGAITKMAQAAGLGRVLCLLLWDAGNGDRLSSSGLGREVDTAPLAGVDTAPLAGEGSQALI